MKMIVMMTVVVEVNYEFAETGFAHENVLKLKEFEIEVELGYAVLELEPTLVAEPELGLELELVFEIGLELGSEPVPGSEPEPELRSELEPGLEPELELGIELESVIGHVNENEDGYDDEHGRENENGYENVLELVLGLMADADVKQNDDHVVQVEVEV